MSECEGSAAGAGPETLELRRFVEGGHKGRPYVDSTHSPQFRAAFDMWANISPTVSGVEQIML